MKGIIALCLVALLAGCSAKQVRPEVSSNTIYRTPIDGATAQLVLPDSFQRKVITQKPTYGNAWAIYNFDVHIGESIGKALVADMRSRMPSARIGNIDDGKPATVRVTPGDVTLEFGVDDGTAMKYGMAFGVLAMGSDVIVGAKVKVRASIVTGDGRAESVDVLGLGAVPTAFLTIRESDIDKAVGLAIEDAAKKLGDISEAKARAASS